VIRAAGADDIDVVTEMEMGVIRYDALSAPFWHRMGYRPLWSTWQARPAAALR
jgi:hypothetical protein